MTNTVKRGIELTLNESEVSKLVPEVRTLVNEIKPAGNYEVEFNASNLPSGVYIYSIQSGDFVSSKKMIMLK